MKDTFKENEKISHRQKKKYLQVRSAERHVFLIHKDLSNLHVRKQTTHSLKVKKLKQIPHECRYSKVVANKHIKIHSTIVSIRIMNIRTIVKYENSPIRMANIKSHNLHYI